jgi:hypothetical protein
MDLLIFLKRVFMYMETKANHTSSLPQKRKEKKRLVR